ncbi:glycoside hydrolase family 5 protein [Brevundimonas sp. NPDC058933]|uniref:glycoside hydrolase family 5 protein n=1 Tax=Brevundimonas sp. NPDC058933 TaxID=3346673 RepID=UPI003BEF3469
MSKNWARAAMLGAAVLATAPGCSAAAMATAPYAAQSLSAPTARQAAAHMGKGFNLGQMFDNSQHPPTLEAARPKIDAYYARGFRNLRIPVTWTEDVDGTTLADPDTGRIDLTSPRLAALTEVIDYALSKPGLYVVLNAHHEKRLKENGRGNVLEQLWSDISERFGDRDHRLIFEILNEPHLANHDPMSPAVLRRMTGLAYDRIRARDAERIIIIGGNQWFGAEEMARTWPNLSEVGDGRDPYLMATFHHYNPWAFAGDNQGDYADAWTDADIRGPMEIMARWASTTGAGMPVYIGEWGVGWHRRLPTMNCNNVRLFYSRFNQTHAADMGMPTAVWDDGGWFQVFDHSTNSFPHNLIDCIDGACTWAGEERFNADCL